MSFDEEWHRTVQNVRRSEKQLSHFRSLFQGNESASEREKSRAAVRKNNRPSS